MEHKQIQLVPMALMIIIVVTGCAAAQDVSDSADGPGEDWVSNLDFAQVRFVTLTQANDGSWRFDVAVEHRDEGWDHYADQWEVVDPLSEEVLAERILLHPHDSEQPFTRSQSGVTIPDELHEVIVRARCTEHGYGGFEVRIDLQVETDEFYTISRR